MEGRKFGERIILYEAEPRHRQSRWVCQCICGNIDIVFGYSLKRGDGNRCQDCAAKSIHPPQREIGKIYNNIIVEEEAGSKNGRQQYKTVCKCGKEKLRLGKELRRTDKKHFECRSCAQKTRWKNGRKWKNNNE